MLRVVAGAGIGFLLSVLWFDLMFDVQVRGHAGVDLPADVRDSIAAYYRRVTTAAYPMNRLVALAMVATLSALVGEVVRRDAHPWAAWVSLALTAGAIGLAAVRTVRNAMQLGTQSDTIVAQSALARAVYRDHLACIVAVAATLVLQIAFAR